MTPEEFKAKWPEYELESGHHWWSTVKASGETQEEAVERLSAELEAHETKKRHRRIGELVERIVASTEHIPDDGRLFIGHRGQSVGIEDDFGEHRHIAGDTLLAALENLAQAIGGDDGD